MRYRHAFTAMVSFVVIAWALPSLRAGDDPSEDDAAQIQELVDRVAESLADAPLSDQKKQRVLRDLRRSLSEAISRDDQADQADRDDAASQERSEPETSQSRATRSADETPLRRPELGRGMRQRQQALQAAAEARRRAEEMHRQAELWSRQWAGDGGPLAAGPFAIGAVLERSGEPGEDAKVVIREVFPGSPAAEAGLQEGDVIVKVDGNPITTADEMIRRVRRAGVDDKTLSLEVSRDDKTLTLEVKPTVDLAASGDGEFGRGELQTPPGMPGRFGFGGPDWRFPPPPLGREIGEIRRRIEDQQAQLDRLQEQLGDVRAALKSQQRESQERESAEDR